MRADEIIWGGDEKCELILAHKIDVPEGSIVEIHYNYTNSHYELKHQQDVVSIDVEGNNKIILDNIYLSGDNGATLVRIIDIEELHCIVEIKKFSDIISFNALQDMRIRIDENIIEKMRARDKENPLEYLKQAFMYQDMMFVKGYGNRGEKFTLLSKDRMLHIAKQNREYTATNLVRYDRAKAPFDAVYILKGNIGFVDGSSQAAISNEVSKKMHQISEGGAYFDIWDAYNDLERIFIFKEATENGILEYDSYTCELTNAFEYKFHIVGSNTEGFAEGASIDCTDDKRITQLDRFKEAEEARQIASVNVGEFAELRGDTCTIIDRTRASEKKFPNQGYLYYSITGDNVRLYRRETAQKAIASRETPLHNLGTIIEQGVSTAKQTRFENPITQMLKRKFPDYDFNDAQQEAIASAINSPDISLILGPPGTGKTTVIKAIIARFEEYYKKHNDRSIPKILITSFQHEAVENVIVGVEGNGIPSKRKGGRRTEESKQAANISEWKKEITEYLTDEIEEMVGTVDNSDQTLRDRIFAWTSKGKDVAEGITLLQEAMNGNTLKISTELRNDILSIISRASIDHVDTSSNVLEEVDEEVMEELRETLEAQRLTPTAYADDGKRQAYALKAILSLEMEDIDVDFIDDVLKTKGQDSVSFKKYIKEVNRLKSIYCKQKTESIAISDATSIEQCLKRLDDELNKSRLASIENKDEATAYILQQYMESIEDQLEIQRIISNYSNITAATCQQAMEVGKFAGPSVDYDLVIVDEAARANPLDLLIPLSMGRQIVLVGDFLQLPHMLDTEVTRQFEEDQRMQELDILKKSLFERLYRMFEKSSGTIIRTVQLTKQYRMNSIIGDFANEAFYQPKGYLLDSSDVDDTKKQANLGLYNDKPLVWLDADKNQFGMEEGNMSKCRPKEAMLIMQRVLEILKICPKKKIGIISFYKKQVDVLEQWASKTLTESQIEQVEIGTVDAFQGKEFDVVFLSCVRANTVGIDDLKHRVGHIQDESRLCVSFTRAKQLLIVVGDRDTVECVPQLGKLVELCEEGGKGYYEQAIR